MGFGRSQNRFRGVALCGVLIASLLFQPMLFACTGITLKPKDGSVIYGRTLEFGADLHSNVIFVPRNLEFSGITPNQTAGLQWKNQYAHVGANAFGLPVILDGLNEKGLAVGLFYFPGYAKYQPYVDADQSKTIAPWQLGSYLLGTCKTIEEARAAVQKVCVANVMLAEMGMVPPAHFIVTDATGQSIVLEYIDGELKIHENPLGVFTNAPSFDWHLTNLGNYVNLEPMARKDIRLGNKTVASLGMGSGMLGMPGDFTPPSRFVRAVAFSQSAPQVKTADEGVLQLFHLLNQFDIPEGAARSHENGTVTSDITLWTSANDLKNLKFYFRTHQNSQIRSLDLKTLDLDGKEILTFSMGGDEVIEAITKPVAVPPDGAKTSAVEPVAPPAPAVVSTSAPTVAPVVGPTSASVNMPVRNTRPGIFNLPRLRASR